MPDEDQHATDPPERRSHTYMDALERRLMAAIKKGDEQTIATLTQRMNEREADAVTKQSTVLARLDTQDTTLAEQTAKLDDIAGILGEHVVFVREQQEQEAEQTRVKAEQDMTTKILNNMAQVKADKIVARRTRWGRAPDFLYGVLGVLFTGLILYAVENLNTLRWSLQTQVLLGVALCIALGFLTLNRLGL